MYVVGPKNIQKVLQDTKIMNGLGQNPTRNLNPSNFYQETEQTHKTRTNPQNLNKPNPRTEKTQTRSTHNKTFFMRKPNLTFILKSDLHSSDS